MTDVRPLCPGCNEPIGAYEPLIRLSGRDATVAEPTSWLAMGGLHRADAETLWHAACAPRPGVGAA